MATHEKGVLLQGSGPKFANKVFYCTPRSRHWVQDGQWFVENGFVWPTDVQTVSDETLSAIPIGRPVGRAFDAQQRQGARTENQLELRVMACSMLHGSGIEFGAASNPLPIPLDCAVTYADALTHAQLIDSLYPGQIVEDMVEPSLVATLQTVDQLPDTFDFIAASHVIEHVASPIAAMIRASTKINDGGHLLLLVPDMTQTFDRERELTTLDHFILDFYNPSRERDAAHYQEFHSVAFPTPADRFEDVWRKSWADQFPIHFHTWTYDSFRRMTDWFLGQYPVYRNYWHHPTCGNEFCFVFER